MLLHLLRDFLELIIFSQALASLSLHLILHDNKLMFVAEFLISLLDLLFLGPFFSRVLLQFLLDRLLVGFKLLPLCSLSTHLLINHLSLVIVCVLQYLILLLFGLFVELLIRLLPPTILHLLPKQLQVFIHLVT